MTIRYEANPPKITPDANMEELILKFVERIKKISKNCDSIHITENVLGFSRVSPIDAGIQIKKQIPNIPLTASLRVRDKDISTVESVVTQSIDVGFEGILILMGDPSQNGTPDSGLVPSKVLSILDEKKLKQKIDLYLSIPNKPNFAKIQKKIDARPKGFITQVIQDISQVENLTDYLKPKGFEVIPILLYPSEKNEKSASFLNLDLEKYRENFEDFVKQTHKIAGDVLLTSPLDFTGLDEFLANSNL